MTGFGLSRFNVCLVPASDCVAFFFLVANNDMTQHTSFRIVAIYSQPPACRLQSEDHDGLEWSLSVSDFWNYMFDTFHAIGQHYLRESCRNPLTLREDIGQKPQTSRKSVA